MSPSPRVAALLAAAALVVGAASCGSDDSTPASGGSTSSSGAASSGGGGGDAGPLSASSVGPGYKLVQQALAGAKGPAGCDRTYKIWYVNPLPTTPDWGRSAKLFKAAGDKLCYKPTVTGPSKIDIPSMVNDIDSAIAAKADAVLTCSLDPDAFKSSMSKARQSGIVVVNIACAGAPGTQDLFLGSLPEDLGKGAAEQLIKERNGQAKIGIVMTDATTPNQVQEVQAFKEAIKGSPGMKIVDTQYDKSDAGQAAEKISQMLTAHPDIDTIWTVEGAAPGAVPTALREAGKSPGDVTVLAIDFQKPTCQAIKDGWIWATQDQLFFDGSPLAAKLAIDIKSGTKPDSNTVNTGYALISKDNLPEGSC